MSPQSISERMLPHGVKHTAQVDQPSSIQMQCKHCNTPDGCQRKNFGVIVTPREMLVPTHAARMEERNRFATQFVEFMGLGVFVIVASLARQCEIPG